MSNVIAGPYKATWNAYALGPTVDGFRVVHRNSGIDITNDLYGDTLEDVLYSGTVLSISFILEHYNATAVDHLKWWMDGANGDWGEVPMAGGSQFGFAQPLILTACTRVPAITPATLTFFKTLPAAGQDMETLFASQPRFLPITLDCYAIDKAAHDEATPVIQRISEGDSCAGGKFFVAT